MRERASIILMLAASVALWIALPDEALASGSDPAARAKQAGEDRWVVSLAITGGALAQDQRGSAASLLIDDATQSRMALRDSAKADDFVVAPFFGGSLELMTPALAIPAMPRLFLSGEIIPTFGSDRALAFEGNPDCVRGPLPSDPCASDEDGTRRAGYGSDEANGRGTRTTARIAPLVFGATLGLAFPLRIGKRDLRIKPSVAWMNYKLNGEGNVVDVVCELACTDYLAVTPFGTFSIPGKRREMVLTATASQRFNGIGAGLDIEMDTGHFGPLGVSLFLGGRAYAVLGDRNFSFGASKSFDDDFGMETASAEFNVEVDPWIFRAHVGIRFQWLGSGD